MKPPKLTEDQRQLKPGRALFGITGLRRVLAPGALKVTRAEFDKAVKLEPQIWETIYQFLDGETDVVPLPPYDHQDVLTLLTKTLDEQEMEDNLAQFRGHPGGDDFIAAANIAAEYLRTKLPRRMRMTWTGPREVVPSREELYPFRRALEAAGNPLWAIRQLLAGTLGREHVDALAAVWPDVLQVARTAYENAKADHMEQNPQWQPGRRQGRQLAVLLQSDPATPPDLVAELQAAFAAEARDQKRAKDAQEAKERDLETTVQKTATKP